MKLAKFVLPGLMCVFLASADSWAEVNVDFDQGVDVETVLKSVHGTEVVPAETPPKPCEVDFKARELRLEGPYRRVNAVATVQEDCSVRLDSVRYSTTPARAAIPPNAAGKEAEIGGAAEGAAQKASFGCDMYVYEVDPPKIKMITAFNHTTWETDSDGLVSGRVQGNGWPNLDWWHVNGEGAVDIWFDNATMGHSYSAYSFYCAGANWCKLCGPGSRCDITLFANLDFRSSGICSGFPRATGQICRGCQITWDINR